MKVTPMQAVIAVLGGLATFIGDASDELLSVGLEEAWLRLASKGLTALVTVLGIMVAGKVTTK